MNIETRQAYSEVNKFLELIGEEMSNKIPVKLRKFFEREMDKNYIPTIQLKNSTAFNPTEYIIDSNGEDVTLCLTSVDMELFQAHYNIYNIEYIGGWKWKSSNIMFRSYMISTTC